MAHARQRGKLWRVKLVSLAVASCFAREAVYANPTGPMVVNGQVTFHQQGNLLSVTNSPGSIINWQSFSIGASEITRFLQQSPSSAVLNRVVAQNPSSILGALQSNGRVFLINPNGILFGAGAQIDVAGLVASTLRLSDADFLAGRMRFTEVAGAGSVINQGAINTAQGGQVYLVGPAVTNQGIITSPKGEVVLAAGNRVELVDPGTPNLRVEITAPDNQAVNLGTIVAEAGRVGIHAGLINQSGTIRADSAVVTEDGRIVLKATKNVTLEAGSLTSASGAKGGEVVVEAPVVIQSGDVRADGATGGSVSVQAVNYLQSAALSADGTQGAGGSVSVQADRIIQTESAVLSANSSGGAGGTVNVAAGQEEGGRIFSSATFSATGDTGGEIAVTGHDVVLRAATLDASGENAGGTVLVGGDWQGGNPAVPNSRSAHVNFSTTLRADARKRGDGGKVVVWSDEDTQFFGTISARGGTEAGDGGRIEVSGKENLVFGGHADAGAPNGRAGMLLLDPKNITIDASAGPSAIDLVDPNIGENDQFGTGAVVLANGNIVAPDSNDSIAAQNGGAVYLFNGTTGGLTSALFGDNDFDQVGSGGITALSNNNFVVSSPNWNRGKGAATWGNGTTGVNGAVSATNSMVGASEGDQISYFGVTALTNGNYVVNSPNWNTNRGAVTWGNGSTGTSGIVGGGNSLVGTTSGSADPMAGPLGDLIGSNGVTALTNGNYVVNSPNWNTNRGAVTWGNGSTGTSGIVGGGNSLVGTTSGSADPLAGPLGDLIGSSGVIALANDNYVVSSPNWNGGRGAVTWRNGTMQTNGVVGISNSLIGDISGDSIGSDGVLVLPMNSNYVVNSPNWNGGRGAVTWGSGATGVMGAVSSDNSLVGETAGDLVGLGGVYALSNGNYVVSSFLWTNSKTNAGAVTWGSGVTGVKGAVSADNSLIGANDFDMVGMGGVTVLTQDHNYVVSSPNWNSNRGAVTWVDGSTSVRDVVGTGNSLTGESAGDLIGSGGVYALTNSNYVVSSPNWSSNRGAVTWVDVSTSVTGIVGSGNSLVGSTPGSADPMDGPLGDLIGSRGVYALTNGNYVVSSPNWNSNRGAVTWGNGSTGVTGIVGIGNSLVGSTPGSGDPTVPPLGDLTGSGGVIALTNGNYVVSSPNWNSNRGAVTWVNGSTGVTGVVGSGNSLVGTTPGAPLGDTSGDPLGDLIGSGGISEISGNRVLVGSPYFDNGAVDSGRLQIYDGSFANPLAFSNNPSGNVTITPSAITAITNTGTAVTLQANNDVTLNSAITSNNPSGNGGALTMQAGRSILVNANITTDNGNLTLVANETAANGVVPAQRDPGNAVIAMAPGTAIDTGTGNLSITLGTGAGLINSASGAITLQSISGNAIDVTNSGSTPGSGIAFNGPVNAGGTFTATTANSGIALNGGVVNGAVLLDAGPSGSISFGNSLVAGSLSATAGGGIADNAGTSLAVTGNASFTGGNIVLGENSSDTTHFGSLTFNSTGTVSITQDSTIVLTGNNSASNLTLASAGAIIDAAGTGLTVTSNASFTGTSITLADNTTDILSVGGNASFNAAGGGIMLGGAGTVNFGSLTFNSTDAVNIAEDSAMVLVGTNTAGNLTLAANGGSITQTSGTVTANVLELSADTGISLPALAVTSIQATNSTSGDVNLSDTGGLSITGISNTGGMISVATTGDLTLDGNVTSGTFVTSLATTGGSISQSGGTVTASALGLAAANGITLDSLAVDSVNAANSNGNVTLVDAGGLAVTGISNPNGAISVATTGNLSLDGNVTSGANATALSATGGAINQTAGSSLVAGVLDLSAATGITLGDLAVASVQATNTTSGAVTLSDAGGLSISGISNANGAITVSTTGGLSVDGNINSGANATSLTATGGSITHAGGALTAGTLALTSSSGSIGQTGGSITAGSAVLNADTGISLTVGSIAMLEATNNVSGNISVTGMSGPLTAGAGGIDNAAAAGNVTLATSGALTLAGDVTVQPGQTISLSGGSIGSTGGNPVADTLLLSSVNGTTLGNVEANRLSAVNTGAGNINLSVQNDVELFGAGLVNAGGDATLTAGGSITQTGGTVSANAVVLTSTNGSIGTGSSGRVNTQAGNLTATANNGGVFIAELDSVNLAGGSAGASGFDLVAGGALAVNGNVTSAGALNLASVGFSNNATISSAGDISIDAGGGAFTNNASGVIAGSGTLDATGTTFINNGTLRPGGAGTVGTLTVIGNATFNSSSAIEIDAQAANAGQYDLVAVAGTASLGGSLNVISMGGYTPANGDVLVPVTFASGVGAFILVPASVFTAAYNANNLTLTVGMVVDLINRWIGTTGNWAVASNWSLGHIPTLDETVVIDVPGMQTITVSSGQLGAFKLTSQENFRITSGQLALDGPSTFNANLTITGGTLTGSGNVVVNGNFDWTGGKLSGPGTFTTTGISTLSPRWRDLDLRRDWINLGTINWRGTNGRDLYIAGDTTLLNATGGTLNLLGGWGSDIRGNGALVNEGTVNKKGGQSTSIKAEFSNEGTLNVKDGTLRLKDSDGNDGTIDISKHATLDVNGPGYANRGVISGTGTLDVKDTRFVNHGTVAPGSNKGAGVGKLTVDGNYRQSASGVLLMDAAGKKSGQYDRLEVTGKATLDGTLTLNAVGNYVPRKGDTLELITYNSRSGTFSKRNGPDGYDLKPSYERKSAKFKLIPD